MQIPGYNSELHRAAMAVGDMKGGYAQLIRDAARPDPSEQLAEIYRSQYQDYKDRFRPVEDILFGFTDPSFAQNLGNEAVGDFTKAYENGEQAAARQMQGYGLSLSPERQRLSNRRQDLGEIQAYNQTKRGAEDLGQSVLGLQNRNRIVPE